MGKRSVKENKNIYQLSRENLGLTREKASQLMEFVSPERIEKIESEKSAPHPDEVLAMSKCYKMPTLCNYYCTHECVIGEKYVEEVTYKDLSKITLETLASLNKLDKAKNRFIEISVDEKVTEDELPDFIKIRDELNRISSSFESLKLWIDQTIESSSIAKLM
ncbi:MAG: helix-turn-helix transcriptional regulator [Lachnospiraceae bacterium]|nr:helix-turn-helix transcriptional regulator [Lachnospiraceae bacterium]